jgi:dimethylaniline monooxygenase (N-oxide forming)
VVKSVAVVGAGAGGLASARHLLAAGHDVTVYEAGSRVGGLWVYESDSGLSAAYQSLHANSESRITALPDFPFPRGMPIYPSHSDVAAYLQSYAETFSVIECVRPRAVVERIKAEGRRWVVELADGQASLHDVVVVASGHQHQPRHPEFAVKFSGEYLHSHTYRSPESFCGKRVLVVGTGNSGLDIAADVCTVAQSTAISARSPVMILPRMIFGVPTQRVLGRLEKPFVPWAVNRRVRQLIGFTSHGRMEQWGFVTAKTRTHPTSHPTLIHHMAWDRIRAKPGVVDVEGETVRFADGSEGDFDVMISATGYEVDVPFLSNGDSPMRDRQVHLYRRMVKPGTAGMFFVGFFNVNGGANIPIMDAQARWLTGVVNGDVKMPDTAVMDQEIRHRRQRIVRRFPTSARYELELEPRIYLRQLAGDLAGGDGGLLLKRPLPASESR